jgi:hypothetical protein
MKIFNYASDTPYSNTKIIGSNADGTTANFTVESLATFIATGGISFLEFDDTTKTIWNNGHGDILSNTSFGDGSLISNTDGYGNTSYGFQSLSLNTTGGGNTSYGSNSLEKNTSGGGNTSVGAASLYENTTGGGNTSVGAGSLNENTTGSSNTSIGCSTLGLNTTGGSNIAVGEGSLQFNTTGSSNISIGNFTESANHDNCIIIGTLATATSNNQIVIGSTDTPVGSVTTVGTFTPSHKFKVLLNGVEYWIQLDAV